MTAMTTAQRPAMGLPMPPPLYTRSTAPAMTDRRGPSSPRRDPAPTASAPSQASAPAADPGAAKPAPKKAALPSPPKVIVDAEQRAYQRGRLLGQGGFARVYEAVDPEGRHKAFKVIAKSAIAKSRKNRAKLLAEIMIHKSTDHIHIVKFEDCFEDDENVYFRLELCSNGSLNDIVKRRGAYTEPEARYFMIQILAGCQNMHRNSIIHRDLKLGNVFLDEQMHVKIGDFGLAALLKYPEERKKTMCGTPNYIAPEILYNQGQGHSFEVDIWSVGVILYTLLVGKPPFQTTEVEKIYERIRRNNYEIPAAAGLSPESQDLITRILTHNPAQRPTLGEIMNHPWFRVGSLPMNVPATATRGTPFLPTITQRESLRNFELLKAQSGWIEEDDSEEAEFAAAEVHLANGEHADVVTIDSRAELEQAEQTEQKREKMDREFNHAIQPESPISALLKAGRQPLVKAPTAPAPAPANGPANFAKTAANSLARQLSSLTLSRSQNGAPSADKENANPANGASASTAQTNRPEFGRSYSKNANLVADDADAKRNQLHLKARIVATAAGMSRPPSVEVAGIVTSASRDTLASASSLTSLAANGATKSKTSIETIISNLASALSCLDEQTLLPTSTAASMAGIEYGEQQCDLNGVRAVPENPRVFIISWLDHSERYGLGYALSDGTVGVHFRDSTSMVLSAGKGHVDYISTLRSRGTSAAAGGKLDQLKRENFVMPVGADTGSVTESASVPKELMSRVRVMKYFEVEIMDRLYGADSPLTYTDADLTTGMVFIHKWYRCKDAIVFRLSNGTVQFNFYDHTKLFLTHGAMVISVIEPVDKTGGVQTMRSWTLAEFVSIANNDRSAREEQYQQRSRFNLGAGANQAEPQVYKTKPAERRQVRSLVKKLRYAKEVLNTTVVSKSSTMTGTLPTSSNTLVQA